MANQIIEIEGTAMWAQCFERNKDTNEDFHGPGGAATINVIVEEDQSSKLAEAGSRIRPKVTDEGVTYKFRRKYTHPIEELGGMPKVVDAEGNDWDPEVSIGNGSKVKVALDVYDTKMGKGTRLRGVQVLDLVEYESEGEGTSNLPDWLK